MGTGLRSIRVSPSLLRKRRTESSQHGKTLHEDLRDVLPRIERLEAARLLRLQDPPREAKRQRVTFFLGDEGISRLESLARKCRLPSSVLLARILNALPDLRAIKPVQSISEQKRRQRSSWKSSLIFATLLLIPSLAAVLGFPIPANLRANSTRTDL